MLESYEATGRVLNISASRMNDEDTGISTAYLLNYKSAPDVLLTSAILASSAFPLLTAPFHLQEKTLQGETVPSTRFSAIEFRDGSLYADIPISMVSREWDVGFTIVSQVNPHVYPFLSLQSDARAGRPSRKRLVRRGAHLLGLLGKMEFFFREVIASLVRLGISLDVWPTFKGVDTTLLWDQAWQHMPIHCVPIHTLLLSLFIRTFCVLSISTRLCTTYTCCILHMYDEKEKGILR